MLVNNLTTKSAFAFILLFGALFLNTIQAQDDPPVFEQEEVDDREVYTMLDVALGEPDKVQVLSLAYQEVSSIPESIGKMTNLEEIYLNDTRIKSLPSALFSLSKLKKLDVSGNFHLKNIPASITSLKNLEFIKFGYNEQLNYNEILKNLGSMPSLKTVNMMSNRLREVPTGIKHLKQIKELNLADNRLLEVPSEIGELTQLEILDLSMNQLTKLPDGLKNLKNLKQLNIIGNNLPDAEINKVKSWLPSCKFDL